MALTAEQKRSIATLSAHNPEVLTTLAQVAARQARSLDLHGRTMDSTSAGRSQIPYFSPILPVCVSRAEGSRMVDVDGNEYVDCHMGYTAGILGHNPPAVVQYVQSQLGKLPGAGYFVEQQVELADLIRSMVPGMERVAFLHSGADALTALVRVARAATRRVKIAKFEGCYHGWHELGMYNTSSNWAGRLSDEPLGQITPRAATAGVSAAAAEELLVLPYNSPVAFDLIRTHASELAAIVVDPVPRFMMRHLEAAGEFLKELRALTEELGILLIFDEVVTGFRLAPGGAAEAFGVIPDLRAYAKITSGLGLSLSVFAGRADLLDRARTDGLVTDYVANKVWASSTTAANALTLAASLAQLRYLRGSYDTLMASLDARHAQLRQLVQNLSRKLDVPIFVDGHPRLYNTLCLHNPDQLPPEARAYFSAYHPQQVRVLRLLTLYARLFGIYMESLPTTDLSVAHTFQDLEQIGAGLERALGLLKHQGVLDRVGAV